MSHEYSSSLLLDFGKDGANLIPVVTQDIISREVLVLSFCNQEAFVETRKTGFATYYSRSRKSLWRKGESSGNRLIVKEIRINCEQNSLLFLVEQTGTGACHAQHRDGTAFRSCYYRKIEVDDSLVFIEPQ